MSKRPRVIIGNWKMHKTIDEARQFVQEFIASFVSQEEQVVGLAVPYTLIYPLAEEVQKGSLKIGAQNMNDASQGAFTGEIAGSMLKDAGAQFVLLGHSERRHLYGEDNAFINRKVKKAIEAGLQPILCVGETEEEHEGEQTHAVIERQLSEGIKDISLDQLNNLIIAYEPVWAIGNRKSATPEIAEEVSRFCRQVLTHLFNETFAEQTTILYGGSVNSSNASYLLAESDIDGLLIGGASLSLETFLQIVNDSAQQSSE